MNSVESKPFDTNVFFAGGAGMFIQYHDILKPAYLYAIVQMIITENSYGLPIDIITHFSFLSILEWYMKRRDINPLKQLDFNHQLEEDKLDEILYDILTKDESIYKLSPPLSTCRLFDVYRKQHMTFPIYVYSEKEEPYIKKDCEILLDGTTFTYLHGDLKECIKRCDQNFTYIFSDIELMKNACEILIGTCSHVLLARDYRYNYSDHCKTFKYDLQDLARTHPFIRAGTTVAFDIATMSDDAFDNIII